MKQILTAATLAVAVLSTAASAVPLPFGGVIFPTGKTAADPVHGGIQTVINDNVIGFRMDPTPATPLTDVGGRIQNRVTQKADGTLNFLPRIRDTFNIDGGVFAITAFRLEGYGTTALDVDFRTDGSGDKGPSSVSRSVSGDIMTFRYDDPLLIDAINPPGRQQESFFPSIVTDVTQYVETGRMTVFGYLVEESLSGGVRQSGDLVSVTVGGLAVPVSNVPVPASVLLLGGALAGFGAIKRKQRR